MSIFRTVYLDCPACGTAVSYQLVHSVNAGRRPDLRDAILDGSFQRETCRSCERAFRLDPEFIYIDLPNRLYIGVWPVGRRATWRDYAARTRATFEQSMGAQAPAEARELAQDVDVRVVFGWHALVEKILARQAGIDDRSLEVAKLAVMRTQEEVPMPGSAELRLVALRDGDLMMTWAGAAPGSADDEPPPVLRVPHQLIADIEADPATWAAARDGAAEGDVVDFQREALAAA
jgi:hypothetical protein